GALLPPGAAPAQAPPAPTTSLTTGAEVTVVADRIEQIGGDNLVVASGNAELTKGSARLLADRIEINRATGDATAQGRVIFYDGEDRLTGQRIDYNIKTGTGVVYEGEARATPYYRIMGERLERLGESVYRVRRGVFTEIPFYWVITDSQDATLSLDAYSRRGVGGSAQYRYVISRDQRGSLGGFFVHESVTTGDTRGLGSAKHDWQIDPGLSFRADLNAVSDDLVLREYQSELLSRSAQRAESNLFLTKTWSN